MATIATVPREIVDVIADEMAWGVERAVEYWMSQIEHALADRELTSLGRLYAIKDVVERYRDLTGKAELEARRA
jgi:alpha-glucosidase (family GH31 glycosyl hydrolase)